MKISKERREISRIERFVRVGEEDGALDALINHKRNAYPDGLPENILEGITDARHFWFSERQRRAGRRLYEAASGIIGFNPQIIGRRGSLAVVELPDSIDPEWQTTRYLDTSGEAFYGLDEEEFCSRAAATASHYYLSLATQVDSSSQLVTSAPRGAEVQRAPVPNEGLAVPALGGVAVQPA